LETLTTFQRRLIIRKLGLTPRATTEVHRTAGPPPRALYCPELNSHMTDRRRRRVSGTRKGIQKTGEDDEEAKSVKKGKKKIKSRT